MPKNPVDHDHGKGEKEGRLRAFTDKERKEKPSDATIAAQREKRVRGSGRVKAFTKIEREGD